MSRMITGTELQRAVEEGTFIEGGSAGAAEGVKYDFRLSPMILKAGIGAVNADRLQEADRARLVIEPGEVVFALTEERLRLPADIVAQLSPKRKLSHLGILTVGGLCVDPGYQGRLLLGLFNISSTPFRLLPLRKVIAATFYRLEEGERGDFPAAPEPLEDFPAELVQVMEKYKPVALQSVNDGLRSLEKAVEAIRAQISSHEQWSQQFKQYLEEHNRQIRDLTADLRAEVETRRSGSDSLSNTVRQVEDTLKDLKRSTDFARRVLMWVGGIISALLIAWLGKLLLGS